MLVIILVVLAVGGMFYFVWKSDTQHEADIQSEPVTKWRDDEVVITYKIKPPHFRDIPTEDPVEEFFSCGYCKHFRENGCEKYGVKGYGIGSVVKTVCDDFKTSFGEK